MPKAIGGLITLLVAALLVGGAIFLVIGLFSWDSTKVNEIGLHYNGGPLEGQSFNKVVPPGTPGRFYGPFDKVIKLPANQRTFIISESDEGDVKGEITAANASGIDVGYETSLWFALNKDPKELQAFFEQVCTKYDNCQGAGWDRMLQANVGRAQETALLNASKNYTTDEMRLGTGIQQIQSDVAKTLPQAVNENVGGDYFQVRGFQINDPDFPRDVVAGYEAKEKARLLTETRKAETLAAQEQAKASQALAQTDPDYIRLQEVEALKTAIEKGQVEFWVLPEGTSVTKTN